MMKSQFRSQAKAKICILSYVPTHFDKLCSENDSMVQSSIPQCYKDSG